MRTNVCVCVWLAVAVGAFILAKQRWIVAAEMLIAGECGSSPCIFSCRQCNGEGALHVSMRRRGSRRQRKKELFCHKVDLSSKSLN